MLTCLIFCCMALSVTRSALFSTTSFIAEPHFSNSLSISAQSGFDTSNTKIVTSDSAATFFARLIPSISTKSSASLIPAVSVRITGIPPKSKRTSITSRVVPSISDTIATSRFANTFKIVDFPAFTGPIRAIFTPSLICSDNSLSLTSRFILFWSSFIVFTYPSKTSSGKSSSEKSIIVSSLDDIETSCSL